MDSKWLQSKTLSSHERELWCIYNLGNEWLSTGWEYSVLFFYTEIGTPWYLKEPDMNIESQERWRMFSLPGGGNITWFEQTVADIVPNKPGCFLTRACRRHGNMVVVWHTNLWMWVLISAACDWDGACFCPQSVGNTNVYFLWKYKKHGKKFIVCVSVRTGQWSKVEQSVVCRF